MQKAMFVQKVLRVTQGTNTGTHKGSLALDFGGTDPSPDKVFAPFDAKVVRVRTDSRNSGECYIESLEPVLYADGTIDYMSLTLIHNPKSLVSTGQIIRQGQHFYNEGGMGVGDPQAFATHLHLEVSRGKSSAYQEQNDYGTWITPNQYPIEKALFLGADVTVLNTGGLNWRKDTFAPPTSEAPDQEGGETNPAPDYTAQLTNALAEEQALLSQIAAKNNDKALAQADYTTALAYKEAETGKLRAAEKDLKATDTMLKEKADSFTNGFKTVSQEAWTRLVDSQTNL